MDIFKLSKSLDELIFDVMMWVIFYPYTLVRVLIWPGRMIDYVSSELRKDPEKEALFDRGLSPPLFLFLSILVSWMLAPDMSADLQKEATTSLGKLVYASTLSLLTYRLATFCLFPFAGALIYEWRTPSGISRESFRQPFFQQAYLCGPLAIVLTVSEVVTKKISDENMLALTGLTIIAVLIWYFWAQMVFFRRTLDGSWGAAAWWAFATLVLATSFSVLMLFIVGV